MLNTHFHDVVLSLSASSPNIKYLAWLAQSRHGQGGKLKFYNCHMKTVANLRLTTFHDQELNST